MGHNSRVRGVGIWVVLVASATLLFVSVWILLPVPHAFLYPLAVGSPEVAPILLTLGILLLAGTISARHASRTIARLAIVFAALGFTLFGEALREALDPRTRR